MFRQPLMTSGKYAGITIQTAWFQNSFCNQGKIDHKEGILSDTADRLLYNPRNYRENFDKRPEIRPGILPVCICLLRSTLTS